MLQMALSVEGSVPDNQNYNSDTREYAPDYTLTPLILQPRVSIIDKDGYLPAGNVNSELVNIRWYQIINGTRTQIMNDNADYEITDSGADAGRLKVKKNAEPKFPITLEFYAEYVDTRTNQILVVNRTAIIKCGSASDQIRVELDTAAQTIYNPLSDNKDQTVTAKVWIADRECPAANYELVWEVKSPSTSWRTVGSEMTDYFISASGNTATIDKELMGNEIHIRCRCKYSASGAPSSVTLEESSPYATAAFVRRIPNFEYDIAGLPVNIPKDILKIAPEAYIRTTKGPVRNPEKVFSVTWYMAKNKSTGTLSYNQVAHGVSPVISTSLMDALMGGVLGLEVKDRGPESALVDSDGAVMTDSDGKIFIIH